MPCKTVSIKKLRVSILFLDKVDLKTKNIIGDKEGHFLIVKEPIYQKDITIISVYVPNNRALRYMKKNMRINGAMDNSRIIVTDFNF